MESGYKQPDYSIKPEAESLQPGFETFDLKELLNTLSELDEQDAETIRVIEELRAEPEPAPDDIEGWNLYREKLQALARFALTLEGSTARNRELRERISEVLRQGRQIH